MTVRLSAEELRRWVPERWGTVELRGLGPGRFRVVDYVNARELSVVEGPTARLLVSFSEHLLIEAVALEP